MKRRPFLLMMIVVVVVAGAALVRARPQRPAERRGQEVPMAASPALARLQDMTARFAPVDITADLAGLPANEQQALAKLVQAGWVMDALFLRQVWGGNDAMLMQLQTDKTPVGQARLHYFLINKGPWSRLDANAAFIPGAPAEKPPAANFYPPGASKADLEAWMKSLPAAQQQQAAGFFTTIRRDGKTFAIVPYSVEYQGELARAADLLREAAALTSEPTLKAFLAKRADAFLSNDYYDSDVAWMELDAAIEPTIGPYEVYEDEFFNFKAAFEAFIAIRDQAESAKLQKLGGELQDIENHLPIDAQYRNPKLGGMAPIRVVNLLLAAGDGNRGVQTAAFNLPNDERIVKEKGAKRVMLKNVQDAKFKMVL
ncbi:MAG: dipeptidyl-peptidase 3 family protein, partial [Bacteroidales bacterium]